MHRRMGVLLCCIALRSIPAQDAPFAPEWRFSGYYLNLLTRSTTLIGTPERYTLDLNRLRLRLDARPLRSLRMDVQYDNELLLGSYLRTTQFDVGRTRVADLTLDLERDYAAGRMVLGRDRLYRASVTWTSGSSDVTVGRQRIAWGTGRFWSPLDVLNPFDATRIERDERGGIDALLLTRQLGALGQWNAVVAPSTPRSPPVAAGYVHWNAGGADFSLAGGRVRNEYLVGGDFAGRLGGLGIRTEASVSRRASGPGVMEVLVGMDYGFASTLTVTGELYFNGAGTGDPGLYDLEGFLDGRVRSLARRYGALAFTYDLTPLLQLLAHGVVNIDDHSRVLWPGLEYSVTGNLYVSGGMQVYTGRAISEYGRLRDVLHVQVKHHF